LSSFFAIAATNKTGCEQNEQHISCQCRFFHFNRIMGFYGYSLIFLLIKLFFGTRDATLAQLRR
jgi:hypothetical protein